MHAGNLDGVVPDDARMAGGEFRRTVARAIAVIPRLGELFVGVGHLPRIDRLR